MVYSIIFWFAACFLVAFPQGRLMPAIRRTPPGPEAKRQDTALHLWLLLAYFAPLALRPTWIDLGAALLVRAIAFDMFLNLGEGTPLFAVGSTATTDKLLRKIAPTNPERLSAILRVGAAFLLACAAVALTL
jgi:hypothetical protein